MTYLEIEILEYLKEHKNEITTLETLLLEFPELLKYETNNSDKCVILRDIIKNINNESDYFVIAKKYTYKIATTDEEVKELLDHDKKLALMRFNTYWRKVKKYAKNGQYDIFKKEFKDILLESE